MTSPRQNWSDMLAAKAARLREPMWWFPFPALLPFGLVLTLTAHLVFSTATRLGHPSDVIDFAAPEKPLGALWFTVTPLAGDIVVTTSDRQVFRWRQDSRSYQDAAAFSRYLKEFVRLEIEAAALAKRVAQRQPIAVIAADQRLRYLHLRPILYALAEAGITQYAFETQLSHRTDARPEAAPSHAKEGQAHAKPVGERHAR